MARLLAQHPDHCVLRRLVPAQDHGMPIPEVAKQVTGISDDMARSQRLAAAARPSYKLRATGSRFDSKDKLKARGYR